MLEIRQVTPDNIGYLQSAAKEDNHAIVCASDLIAKDGEIIGYVGIGTMPCVQMWMHTKKAKARDSMTVMSYVEGVVSRSGNKAFFLPCQSSSPFFPYLERIGFVDTTYTNVFIKKL